MNFIFDIGNVLVNFRRKKYLNELFPGEQQSLRDKVYETIFASREWQELDRGVVTHEEACEIFRIRQPEIVPAIDLAMARLEDMLTPMPETAALLPIIKDAGHGLYFLSNYHKKLSAYIFEKYSFFNLFDGGVFSCEVNINKPSPEIYRCLLEKYKLKPETCVFFDDIQENVDAGEGEGIKGVLFTGADCVKPFI